MFLRRRGPPSVCFLIIHLSTGRPLSGVSLGGVLSVSTDMVVIASSDLEPRFISLIRVNHAQEI